MKGNGWGHTAQWASLRRIVDLAVAPAPASRGPYKASISLNSPVFAYALGQHAADWLEGRSVPQAMDILPSAISAANVAQYEADLADPAAVWRDAARRASYLMMYGNICHDTRDKYLNFLWSSERRPTAPVRQVLAPRYPKGRR